MGWLEGYVTLVTGGARGIGRAVVERYLDEGAHVGVVDRDSEALSEISRKGRERVRTFPGDVRSYETHSRAVAGTLGEFGRLDVLVGNAGVFDFNRSLSSYRPDTLARTLDELISINLRGYLFSAMAAREALSTSRGSMIFTASIAGFHAGCAGIVYTAAKHAVVGIIRQLALELAPDVRVNGVGPGGTLTDLAGTEALAHHERTIRAIPQVAEKIAESVPLGFAQRPQDHAGLYVLLASRENARAVTGEVLMSDGGVGVRPV